MAGLLGCHAFAGPVFTPATLPGPNDVACVAASPLAMYSALGDSFEDRVLVRDARDSLIRTITRAEMQALAPWLTLSGGPDGPSALTFSATGKQLFVLVHDDTLPSDGLGSDVILRYDVPTDALTLFARLDAFDRGDEFPHPAMVHHRAVLYVSSMNGASGVIRAYQSTGAPGPANLLATWSLPAAGLIRGLTVDQESHTLFVSTSNALYRAPLTNTFPAPPSFTLLASTTGVRDLAWSDSYGFTPHRGLYLLRNTAPTGSTVEFVSAFQALNSTTVSPVVYTSNAQSWHSITARGDGSLIIGQDEHATIVRESLDPLLGFDAWMQDELQQVIAFARGLISPDGEPPGWVIDADTTPSQPRFHPATPDAAAWAIFLLLVSDHLNNDPQAQAQIRTILTRYAGLASDTITPARTSDGMFLHWINPQTGGVQGTWPAEYATLSTMKIVAGAARAMSYYQDDPQIARSASRIIFRTRNWDAYILPPNAYAMALVAQSGGGPDGTSMARPFHEGLMFIEQASVYGGTTGDNAWNYWINRVNHPFAQYVPGMPISATGTYFEPAFISIYPALLSRDYRSDALWQAQLKSIRWSNAAWTDDFGPRYSTVFSAGTTRADWGGYHADSLTSHPGDVTTFTSLLGLCAFGDVNPAGGAYHAYRRGARQTFRTGANILYRRSDVDRSYSPNSAGLPDVASGALSLAEVIEPGTINTVLARPYPIRELCPTDLDADGTISMNDLYRSVQLPSDLNGDLVVNNADVACQVHWIRRHETKQLLTRE